MKKWLLPVLITGVLLGMPAIAEDRMIDATGEGVDMNSALRAAQRSAIEQAVGVYVNASTKVKDFEVIEDNVRAHSEAFIRTFKQLGEPQKTPDGLYIVRIQAVVTDEGASQIKDDLAAMGLQLQQGDWPKVLVYCDEESIKGVPEFMDPMHLYLTKWTVDSINSTLGKKGFDYVLPEEIERLKKSDREILKAKGGKDSVIREIAGRLHAEYYLKFRIHQENGKRVALSVNFFDASTGAGKGSETGYGSIFEADSLTKALTQAAETALDRPNGALSQLLNAFKREAARGREYVLVFENLQDDDQLDTIQESLEAIAKTVKLTNASGDHAEFTLYADELPTVFQRTVRKALKGKVKLDGKNVVRGNRINLFVTR